MTQFKHGLELLLSLFLVVHYSFAQHNVPQSRIWAVGNKKGLDFSTNPPTIINTGLTSANEGSATVSNHLGQLQFCTNGTNIWNAEGNLMPHGSNINGSGLNTASTTQAAVIIPLPNQVQKYLVFSLTPVPNCRLYSNLVDMDLDNGLGDVDTTYQYRKMMLRNGLTEKMVAAPGCNNDVWLLVHSNVTPTFFAYHITEYGLDTNAVVSHVGNLVPTAYNQGVMKVSPDGRSIMTNTFSAAGGNIGTEIYDFDPSTGSVSNARLVDVINAYGGTFSPKGSKLYVQEITNPGSIYQFDLNATDITATKTLVGRSGQYCDMKIGPDDKIYVASNINSTGFNSYRFLARINAPDVAGVGCDFQDTVSVLAFPAATGSYGTLTQGLPNEVIVAKPSVQLAEVKMDALLCNVEEVSVAIHLPSNAQSVAWNENLEGVEVELTAPGVYVAKYFFECANYIDTFKVNVGNIAIPTITRDADSLIVQTQATNIRWYLDGEVLSNTSRVVPIERSGIYRVEVESPEGCVEASEWVVESDMSVFDFSIAGVKVYPNPIAGNDLTIECTRGGVIRVVDMKGKILYSRVVNDDELQIDFSQWSSGVFILELIDEKKNEIYQTKVVR